jgi:multidrug efflux pump subunit AcrA (membrane-fusion protein)
MRNRVSSSCGWRWTRGDWRIGDAVQVGIPSSEQRQAVVVPRDALVLRKNEIFVFRIKDGTTAERVTVTTGAAFGDLIEIEGGIEVGDSLVIRGAERLSDGQTVEVRS